MSHIMRFSAMGRRGWRNAWFRRHCFPQTGFDTKPTGLLRTYYVVSFGDNSSGALGLGEEALSAAYEPEPVPNLPPCLVRVSAGHYHSLAVTESGKLYGWGRNAEGQLGPASPDLRLPSLVPGLEDVRVVDAVGSGVISVAIDGSGEVWVWGSSRRGQLGLGQSVLRTSTPRQLDAFQRKRIKQVALGWGHALALTEEGEVYAWGYAKNGRLGFRFNDPLPSEPASDASQRQSYGSTLSRDSVDKVVSDVEQEIEKEEETMQESIVWTPTRVQTLEDLKIEKIACGLDHSLVLTSDGKVYEFGDQSLGRLSNKTTTWQNLHLPLLAPTSSDHDFAIDVAAGLSHSLAAIRLGHVNPEDAPRPNHSRIVSWGHDPSQGPSKDEVRTFSCEVNVSKVSAGRAHSAALGAGRLLTWGSGKDGRLGLSTFANHPEPTELEGLDEVVDFACGFDHTLALVSP